MLVVKEKSSYSLSQQCALRGRKGLNTDLMATPTDLLRCGQLMNAHPVTLHHFLLTWLEVKGQWVEPTYEVEVRESEGMWHLVMLSES